jgi:hypothetical protein
MSHTRTRNDLVNEALANLGILAAGQDPAAEDFQAVDGKVDALVAWLEAVDIIDIDDIDQIVPEWFGPLAVLLADEAALMFGLPGVPHPQGEPDPTVVAIDKLRLTTYGRPTYERLRGEYF